MAYLEKTNLQVDFRGGTPIGTGVQAEGRHQRQVDREIDDKPTYCRRTDWTGRLKFCNVNFPAADQVFG